MNINTVNTLNQIDKGFNIAGSIPFVGLASGAIRAIAYKIVAVAGAVMATVGLIGSLASDKRKWITLTEVGSELLIQGALNSIRGYGEATLGILTYGLGNAFLLIPNMAKTHEFSPFIPWGTFSHQNQFAI